MISAITAGIILRAGASGSVDVVEELQSPPAEAGEPDCLDFPQHWVDNAGRSCLAYFQQEWCTPDGGYGPGWGSLTTSTFNSYAHRGHSAVGACCACGGGVRGEMLDILRQAIGGEPHEPAEIPSVPAPKESASGVDSSTKAPPTTTTTAPTSTTTTTTTFHTETRSEIHCYTEDRHRNTFGSWGQPTAPDGADCHFPFEWQGVSYDECTTEQYDRMWCYVGPNPADGWGNCQCEELRYQLINQCRTTGRSLGTTAPSGADCYFPFEFEGRNYTSCTTASRSIGDTPWCAVGPTIDAGWGDCACEANWVDVSADTANVCIDMIRSYPDLDAWGDDCSYYIGREDECGQSDSDFFVAKDLCCACGGGNRLDHTYELGDNVLVKNEAQDPWTTMVVSQMIPTKVVPMGSPEGTEEQTFPLLQPCNNNAEWRDRLFGEGLTSCEDLAIATDFGTPEEWCSSYDEASTLVRLHCPMVCGTCLEVRGGVRPEMPEDPETVEARTQLSCTDVDGGQVDSDGDDCEYYQRYPHSCGCCDSPGRFVAAELCCACGGGVAR